MKYAIKYLVMILAIVSLTYGAQNPAVAAPYSAFRNWAPIIFIASLLGVMLAGVYYFIGYLLNNQRIKTAAVSELVQAGGSIVLVIVIIAVLYMLGSSDFSFGTFLGPSGSASISNICNTYLNYQNPQYPVYLNSNSFDKNYFSSSPSTLPEPTTAVCQYIIGSPANKVSIDPLTRNIDYGMAATYVVIANMTNQSLYELNAVYNLDSVLFFLRNLKSYVGFCMPVDCAVPEGPTALNLMVMYSPFQGYAFQRSIMPTIVTQASLTLYMQSLELLIIIILLIFWPYLLGAGIVLRTIPFTRRAGGLIVAATIVGVIIFPTVFLIEYGALSNMGTSQTFIGASQIPGIALCGFSPTPTSGGYSVLWCYTSANTLKTSYIYKGTQPARYPDTISACTGALSTSNGEYVSGNPYSNQPSCFVKKQLSLYAYPDAAGIMSFYFCYPTGPTVMPVEFEIITETLIQGALLPATAIVGLFSNTVNFQSNPLVNFIMSGGIAGGCFSKIGPHNVVATLTSLVNMYGIITVSGFIIPILNLLIMLSAMTGISSLIGGETSIIGLSRFL